MSIHPDFAPHLLVKDGFCYPDWNSIYEVLQQSGVAESEWDAFYQVVSRQWVDRLRDSLGGEYRASESPHFLLLFEQGKADPKRLATLLEKGRQLIVKNFGVTDAGYGKHVAIVFTEHDDYYAYISHFFPDGEHPLNGGICLRGGGYTHLALPLVDCAPYDHGLIHELTHVCLTSLWLPAWLDEALAMRMEEVAGGAPKWAMDVDQYEKHTTHWNGRTIQEFWSGRSWGNADEGFELAYELASILLHKIEADLRPPRKVLHTFIAAARAEDAGERAAHSLFKLSLGELVEDFLGEGDWAPQPEKWERAPNDTPLPPA